MQSFIRVVHPAGQASSIGSDLIHHKVHILLSQFIIYYYSPLLNTQLITVHYKLVESLDPI